MSIFDDGYQKTRNTRFFAGCRAFYARYTYSHVEFSIIEGPPGPDDWGERLDKTFRHPSVKDVGWLISNAFLPAKLTVIPTYCDSTTATFYRESSFACHGFGSDKYEWVAMMKEIDWAKHNLEINHPDAIKFIFG